MAEDYAAVRQRIMDSLFSKTNEAGILEDTYVSHLKVWEDVPPGATQFSEDQGSKPRYLMISITVDGKGHLYKGKRNSNGSFSIGKRWLLDDLRIVEVPERTSLNLTMNRVYRYRFEPVHETDVNRFVISTAHLFERLHGRRLQVIGVNVPPVAPINGRLSQANPGQSPPTAYTAPPPPVQSRRPRAAPALDMDASSSSVSSPPPTSARPALRPASSSSYGSAPGTSRAFNTMSTASSGPPGPPPPRARTPVSSSLRTSTASGSGLRSPAVAPPPLPDDRPPPTISVARSRPQTPQSQHAPLPSETVARPSDSVGSLATARPQRSRTNSHASSSHSARRSRNEERETPPPAAPASVPTPTPPPEPRRLPSSQKANGSSLKPQSAAQGKEDPISSVERIHAAEQSFALTLDTLDSVEDEFGFEATLANVEEMIDGFEWTALSAELGKAGPSTGLGGVGKTPTVKPRARGAADQIQSRLQEELSALEKANIHSYLQSDDRVLSVMKLIDETIAVIDDLDGYMSSYKVQLNSVSEDISYIQSRNRGLQVQTQNQNALLGEIQQLLSTVHVDVEKLLYLSQGSPQTDEGIRKLEETAADLYKAMLAARENEMAATMERLDEYRTYNSQFTTRLTQFLSVMFSAQAALVEKGDSKGKAKMSSTSLPSHADMEEYISRYGGLLLYTREMDEKAYAKICGTYFSVASELHAKEMKPMMNAFLEMTKKAAEEGDDFFGFSTTPTTGMSRINTQLKRNNTTAKGPGDRRDRTGGLLASEAFTRALGSLVPQIFKEESFIADFLQIHEGSGNTITFADYMSLESYFRRQAARTLVLGGATKQLIRGAQDLIFGFLPEMIKVWIDGALAKDSLQVVGIVAALERYTGDAEERGNTFLQKMLQKQSQRLTSQFARLVDEQIKAIDQTKLTTKKRSGVVNFIRYFPVFVGRLEIQLIGADQYEIRGAVDNAYEQIVQVMFESLQQMAKMSDGDAGGEDKGILNFHVILIENMHYFIQEVAQQELGAMQGFLRRAQAIYDDNLNAYVKIVLRRPMGKILEFFEGVERLLKTTAPSQVAASGAFSKSALKKVVKDHSQKDVRKAIEALYKRVEKHFSLASEQGGVTISEEGTALVDVWKACESEMVRDTDKFGRLISQCYEGTGVQLEFTVSDVEAFFRSARKGR